MRILKTIFKGSLGILLLGIIVCPLAFSEEAAVAPAGESLLQKANNLQDAGEFLEAKTIYEELLQNRSLTPDQLRAVESDYEKLNMQLLFSRYETPGSLTYTVKAGDNLYNIAKNFGTTVALIKKINGLQQDVIYPDMKLKIQQGTFSAVVDKSDNQLQLFLDGKLLKTYPVATGENNSTPTGEFRIVNKLIDPTWYHAGAIVSPDSPDNILGTRWMGFDYKGYGIHGTTLPETIGKQSSAGCIRMLNEDVEELYELFPVGTKVKVKE